MTSLLPVSQFPLIEDFFVWNGNQSGTLHLTSTNLKSVISFNNQYTAANLSGCFPAGGECTVNLYDNDLTSLDISNDPGLFYLNVSRNSLNQTAVDGILQTLDSYKTSGGYVDLTENAAPSRTGVAHASNLTAREWKVQSS